MTERIWTQQQYAKLFKLQKKYSIPHEVIESICKVVEILDRYYGKDRNVDTDDGGYLVLFTECLEGMGSIYKILENYHVHIADAELEEVLCFSDGLLWKSVLYLITNDYGITVIYPCKGGGI